MSVWVFSPVHALIEGLRLYVAELGYAVEIDPTKARVALFDLTASTSPLPPVPAMPSLAILGPDEQDGRIAEVRRAGYTVQLATDGEDRLRSSIATLLAGRDVGGDRGPLSRGHHVVGDTPRLTPRETQVLSLLMLGLTNKRIAKHLAITERTVKFHVTGLMRKHGVNNRSKLMLRNPIVVTRLYGGDAAKRA